MKKWSKREENILLKNIKSSTKISAALLKTASQINRSEKSVSDHWYLSMRNRTNVCLIATPTKKTKKSFFSWFNVFKLLIFTVLLCSCNTNQQLSKAADSVLNKCNINSNNMALSHKITLIDSLENTNNFDDVIGETDSYNLYLSLK
jgi:hypothetical protein